MREKQTVSLYRETILGRGKERAMDSQAWSEVRY